MNIESPLSLAALVSHPIQYQAPLFRAIDDTEGVDLTVYFCDDRGAEPALDPGFGEEIVWDRPLLEGYEHVFLNNWRPSASSDPLGDINPGIVSRLRTSDHDVLWVHGYTSITNWLAFLTANIIDLPLILRGESTLVDRPSAHVRIPKNLAIRGLTYLVDAYGVIGSRNREFYRSYGINERKLFNAPYSVHNKYFQTVRRELPSKAALRDEIGIPDRPTVLFVGKLIERKRPGVLLEAFTEFTSSGEANLLYVGDGERRADLEKEARRRDRADDIRFVGFQNQSELPRFYEASDLFVLPSAQENWGLVVNEAMNFELPVITTSAVGSAADLVSEKNGCVVPVDNPDALGSSIHCVLFKRNREWMGKESLEIIQEWGISDTAEGIVRAAKYVK